jgi:hypothetical protein
MYLHNVLHRHIEVICIIYLDIYQMLEEYSHNVREHIQIE